MNTNNHISYIEFRSTDLEATKSFYSSVFEWEFKDYGSTYISFRNSGVLGGFERTEDPIQNGVLVVLYHDNLNQIKEKVIKFGGKISIDTFDFPGGRRFQFIDPVGNELAIWSDK